MRGGYGGRGGGYGGGYGGHSNIMNQFTNWNYGYVVVSPMKLAIKSALEIDKISKPLSWTCRLLPLDVKASVPDQITMMN